MIDATAAQLELIESILRAHVPGASAWVFGSRARGDARPASDLDLLLADSEPIELPVLWRLKDAFEESTLPWRVDVVDRARASAAFLEAISGQLTPLVERPLPPAR